MFNTLSKALLSFTYLVALASLFVVLPMEAGPVVQKLALALLVSLLRCALLVRDVM
jgi:hypothetical protein